MDKLQLIDFLSEDDFLIQDSDHRLSGEALQDFRFRLSSVGSEDIDENRRLKLISTQEAKNEEEPPPDKRKENSFLATPIRQPSFGWDDAFFTNPGVLDPEELVLLNNGARSPLLQEDYHKHMSPSFHSTLDSDNFSIASNLCFEDDLFEDVRASIERSCTIPNIYISGCKSGVKDACKKKPQIAPKKPDSVSQIRRIITSSLKPPRREATINTRKKLSFQEKARSGNKTPASKSGKVSTESKKSSPRDCSPVPFGVSFSPSPSPFRFFSKSRQKSDNTGSKNGIMNEVSYMSSYSYESPVSSIEGWLTEASSTSTNQGSIFSKSDPALESTEKFRPSGLRMPSPKIGFFDEERSMMASVRGSSGARSVSSKTQKETEERRQEKPPRAKVVLKKVNDTPKAKQNGTRYLSKVFSSSPKPREFPGKATIDQVGVTSPSCKGNFRKARKVCDGGQKTRKLGLHSSLNAENTRIEGSLKKGKKLEKLARRIFPSKSEARKLKNPTEMSGNRRESLVSFEDQFDALMKHFEVIDLSNDTLIDIDGKKSTDLDHYFREKVDTASSLFGEEDEVSMNLLAKSGSLAVTAAERRIPLGNMMNSICSGVV